MDEITRDQDHSSKTSEVSVNDTNLKTSAKPSGQKIVPTRLEGLTPAEVRQRIDEGKHNDVTLHIGRSNWEIFRANVFTRINAMLGVLLVFVLATGSWINAAFGLLIICNSGIGIIQEIRAKRMLEKLSIVGEAKPRIRREDRSGHSAIAAMPKSAIVVDDIIELGPGDQVVVDGIVREAGSLDIDESLLTGESDSVEKNVGDRVLSGSFVVSGFGTYQATAVGREAYAAQLAEEASAFSLTGSQLMAGINSILKFITFLLVPTGILTIWASLRGQSLWPEGWGAAVTDGDSWQGAVLAMAGALVPMVPEGLVLMTSIAFFLGVIRLGRKKCLVQELPAIEGLARVDVVCADKTGTLTENGMRLSEILAIGSDDSVSTGISSELREAIAQLAFADPRPNASVEAIIEGAASQGITPDGITLWKQTSTQPFSSVNKWSGIGFAGHGNWILGAPDVLASPGSEVAQRAEHIGEKGLRVLLVATADQQPDTITDVNAPGVITPRALVVLEQRIRPDARDTLEYFDSQHVVVKVISGDNAKSVGAVTSSLGLKGGDHPVDARSLPDFTTDEQDFVTDIDDNSVFGRVSPVQKQQMVRALQSRDHAVAMTGDGVNDVLALKDSDIGVAMGAGAPATRAVAQIVLLDNKFATLPSVVAEGRRVIANIERVAKLFLTKTVYSTLFALAVVLTGFALPFQPIHVTVTGWFTIGIPAFFLSLPPNNHRAQSGFTRRVLSRSMPCGVIVATATYITYVYLMTRENITEPSVEYPQIVTATLVTLIISATWVLAIVARPYQWWKIVLISCSILGYVILFSLPASILKTYLLLDTSNPSFLITGIAVGLVAAVLVEATWWVDQYLSSDSEGFWESNDASSSSQLR